MSIVKKGYDREWAAILRKQYESEDCLFLPGFFDSFLAKHFRSQMNLAEIEDFYKTQAGEDFEAMDYSFNPQFVKEYNYLINQTNYLDFLSAVTGNEIGCMQGHVHVSDNSKSRGYGYHSDDDGNRHFLVSINISDGQFEGGLFKLRETNTKKIKFEIRNTDPGGALIARVGSDLEHSVSDVTGEIRRIVLLSWALKQPQGKRFSLFG